MRGNVLAMRPLRVGIALVATLLVAGWCWFVWPTPWRYVRLPDRAGAPPAPLARVHRVTGRVEFLSVGHDGRGGWVRLPPIESPSP